VRGASSLSDNVERTSWSVSTLQEQTIIYGKSGNDLIAIDDALETLAAFDARKSEIVELRFFGGLSVKETAAVLTVSEETVRRDWNLAKSWLRQELTSGAPHGT